MAYDTFVMAACLAEIKQAALGAKVNKIHQPEKNCLLLRFFGRNGQSRLLLSAAAESARLHLTGASPANPAQPPLFLMVARKWLEGATLQDISQTPCERVATFVFATRNEVGDPINLRLICEIMGKHSNIILTDEGGRIIDGIRRYDSRLSRYREVLPQRPYLPPPPQHKAQPPFTDEEELSQALLRGDWQEPIVKALPRYIAAISPWLAREMLAAAQLKENTPLEELGAFELARLLRQVNELAQRPQSGEYSPTLLLEQGQPQDFAAFAPRLWQEQATRAYSGMSEALDVFYAARQARSEFARQQHRLIKGLQQHISRLERKISAQREDLAASERGESYKESAELLAAHLYTLREQAGSSGRGLTEVFLPSFSAPEQTVRVELEPALNPQQNIQRLYHKYNKCHNSRSIIAGQLKASETELEYLNSIAVSVDTATLPTELAEIEQELTAAGLIAPPPAAKGKKAPVEAAAPLPPRSYLSADGFTILVGRNNKQNERLSLKTAAADDMWLHTQKIPGSHVIILREGKEIPDSTLIEAASYAAWFSQARQGGKVAVDYTRAALVKKIPGAKPGMVIYSQQQTVYVEPKKPINGEE